MNMFFLMLFYIKCMALKTFLYALGGFPSAVYKTLSDNCLNELLLSKKPLNMDLL